MPSVHAVDEDSHSHDCLFAERQSRFSFSPSATTLVYEFPKLIMSASSLSHVPAMPQLPHQHWKWLIYIYVYIFMVSVIIQGQVGCSLSENSILKRLFYCCLFQILLS